MVADGTTLPRISLNVAASCRGVPTYTSADGGVIVPVAGAPGTTIRITDPVADPDEAVTVTNPGEIPSTAPVLESFAIRSSLLDHVRDTPETAFPFAFLAIALS